MIYLIYLSELGKINNLQGDHHSSIRIYLVLIFRILRKRDNLLQSRRDKLAPNKRRICTNYRAQKLRFRCTNKRANLLHRRHKICTNYREHETTSSLYESGATFSNQRGINLSQVTKHKICTNYRAQNLPVSMR